VLHVLKALYDADLLEEDVILAWSKKPSKKFVSKDISQQIHDKVVPFIKWLEEADEETSEEEEELEVVYSSRSGGELKIESVPTNNGTKAAQQPEPAEEEDDIDIDDI